MLRNAVSVYDEAHTAAVRLLACVLAQPNLRASLKAEMGAFVPLLLLRPLEQDRWAACCQHAHLQQPPLRATACASLVNAWA